MRNYAIVPAFGKDKIQGVFRENDNGVLEAWKPQSKSWEFSPFHYRFLTGSDIGYHEISPKQAARYIDA